MKGTIGLYNKIYIIKELDIEHTLSLNLTRIPSKLYSTILNDEYTLGTIRRNSKLNISKLDIIFKYWSPFRIGSIVEYELVDDIVVINKIIKQ